MRFLLTIAIAILLVTTIAYSQPKQSYDLKLEKVAGKLNHPWSLAFLPDGRMLVTERSGNLRYVTKDGKVSEPIKNVPPVYAEGQGGLLDVVLDPNFKNNKYIYLSYAEGGEELAGTAVAKAKLDGDSLSKVETIFRQKPKKEGGNHFGSRLVFDQKGNLFVTLGERFDSMDDAQRLGNHLGKIVRIRTDGKAPKDNPFTNMQGVLPEIYSYGHRNVQGAAINPATGELWTHEHGPRGGDEINISKPGRNYGWPDASYGIHYWMVPIKSDHAGQGFEEPVYHWTPSIAPSGMMFYTGDKFPAWRNDLFVGALVGKELVRLELRDNKVIREEKLLRNIKQRIRDIRQGPDGYIYLLTDEDEGEILRIMSDEDDK